MFFVSSTGLSVPRPGPLLMRHTKSTQSSHQPSNNRPTRPVEGASGDAGRHPDAGLLLLLERAGGQITTGAVCNENDGGGNFGWGEECGRWKQAGGGVSGPSIEAETKKGGPVHRKPPTHPRQSR